MSFGKMNTFAKILKADFTTDSEGFKEKSFTVEREVRCYHEGRHGSLRWVNLAAFSAATDLFRLRAVPGCTVTTDSYLLCGGEYYKILSVENVKGRGMYVEILAERVSGSNG